MRLKSPRVILVIIFFALFASAAFAQNSEPANLTAATQFSSPPEIMFDGEVFLEDNQTVVRNGVLFIPLDDSLADALDARIEYSTGKPLIAKFRTMSNSFKFTENSSVFTSAGSINSISEMPFSSNGLLYVPLYDLFRALNISVSISGDVLNISAEAPLPEFAEDIPDFAIDPTTFVEQPLAPPTDVQDTYGQGPSIQYTYENQLEFENIAISGNRNQSNQDPKTEFYNTLSFRFMGTARDNYTLNSSLKMSGTTDRTINQGEVIRFNTVLKKNSVSLSLYDIAPKVSRFVLKSYQAQGIEYSKRIGNGKTTLMWGKSPKKFHDSTYNRYVTAFIHEIALKGAKIGASVVRTKDTGVDQPESRINNNVVDAYADFKLKDFNMNVEVARSGSRVFYGNRAAATAKWIEAKYRDRTTTFSATHERVGSEFVSETSFFTAGRTETIMLINKKLNKNFTISGGYKVSRLLGETTTYRPIQINTKPFSFRPYLRLKIQDNYEEARNIYGPRMTDKQKLDVSDRLGKAKVNLSLERRRQRDVSNVWKFRTSQKYRYTTPITKKTMLFLQYKHELKTASSNPKKRYYQCKFVIEPVEWSELSLNIERYYAGTSNDRYNTSISYKKLDIMNDREYGIEYGFQNYSGHNDNTFKVTYSFIR